ncbi:MAG: M23 family metallopeptidase [Campylobacterota bacterium]|nr:M23 family metallopeptidase [Campylobacterota bacterium]
MKESKYTISIHGEKHGLRQYEIDSGTKKLLYIGLFLIFFFLSVILFVIIYLNQSLGVSREEEHFARSEYKKMKASHSTLYETMTQVQKDLFEKEEALSEANIRMDQIEARMGLVPTEDVALDERIVQAELTSEQIAPLMRYIPNGSPIEYKGITSKYGYRTHPVTRKRELHRGSDMKAAMKTPVYATADAVVEFAGYHKSSGFGYLIILSHNYGFRTYFGHLSKVSVKSGTYIKKGDLIGYTGNSGLSSGPHLHYEVRYIQQTLNPFWFIKWNSENYQSIFSKEKKVPWQSLITAIAPQPRQTVKTPLLSLKVPSSVERSK